MKQFLNKTVEFENPTLIDEYEINFDAGMRARVIKVDFKDDVWELLFDFSEFEECNKKFAQADFYDYNGQPVLKWHETPYYPKNKKENCFFCENMSLPFKVVG